MFRGADMNRILSGEQASLMPYSAKRLKQTMERLKHQHTQCEEPHGELLYNPENDDTLRVQINQANVTSPTI